MSSSKKSVKKLLPKGSKTSRVRIRLKSYDYRQLDAVAQQIVNVLETTGANLSGPIPLPTKIRKYCVNSSTHVDKRSGEHFEIRTHSRILEIIEPAEDTMGTLQKIDLPAGVGVTIQVIGGAN